jgi:hypothetical protein
MVTFAAMNKNGDEIAGRPGGDGLDIYRVVQIKEVV